MGKLKPFIFGTIFGGGIAFVALQYHLVRSAEGFRLIPRSPQPSIGLAYADIRGWGDAEWQDREELASAIVDSGATDLVRTSLDSISSASVSTNSSALDELRNLMQNSQQSLKGDSSDQSGFLTIPEENELPKNGRDLFSIPFEEQTRKRTRSTTASRDGISRTSSMDVARRELPSIDEILGEPISRADDPGRTTSPLSKSSNKLRSSFEAQQETESFEEMLFGNDPEPSLAEANEQDSSSGLFQDITNEVQGRARDAVNRAGETLHEEKSKAFKDARNSVDRYVRDRVDDVLPDSVSSMFEEDAATDGLNETLSQDDGLSPALKAIQDGFDPFIK